MTTLMNMSFEEIRIAALDRAITANPGLYNEQKLIQAAAAFENYIARGYRATINAHLPKPIITVPSVGMGAVITFTTPKGRKCRALNKPNGEWIIAASDGHLYTVLTTDLLSMCNGDGFTIELEGLK